MAWWGDVIAEPLTSTLRRDEYRHRHSVVRAAVGALTLVMFSPGKSNLSASGGFTRLIRSDSFPAHEGISVVDRCSPPSTGLSVTNSQLSRLSDPVIVVGDSITEAAIFPEAICGHAIVNAGIGSEWAKDY